MTSHSADSNYAISTSDLDSYAPGRYLGTAERVSPGLASDVAVLKFS